MGGAPVGEVIATAIVWPVAGVMGLALSRKIGSVLDSDELPWGFDPRFGRMTQVVARYTGIGLLFTTPVLWLAAAVAYLGGL